MSPSHLSESASHTQPPGSTSVHCFASKTIYKALEVCQSDSELTHSRVHVFPLFHRRIIGGWVSSGSAVVASRMSLLLFIYGSLLGIRLSIQVIGDAHFL